jgi:hypothetical protein
MHRPHTIGGRAIWAAALCMPSWKKAILKPFALAMAAVCAVGTVLPTQPILLKSSFPIGSGLSLVPVPDDQPTVFGS